MLTSQIERELPYFTGYVHKDAIEYLILMLQAGMVGRSPLSVALAHELDTDEVDDACIQYENAYCGLFPQTYSIFHKFPIKIGDTPKSSAAVATLVELLEESLYVR